MKASNPVADPRWHPRRLPPWPKMFSISCSFSENLASGGLASPTGNPGSAPEINTTIRINPMSHCQWLIQDFPDEGANFNFAENCMK